MSQKPTKTAAAADYESIAKLKGWVREKQRILVRVRELEETGRHRAKRPQVAWHHVRHGWIAARRLADELGLTVPPEPSEPLTILGAINALGELLGWCDGQLAHQKPPAGQTALEEPSHPQRRRPTTNMLMLDAMQNNPECRGWTAEQWASALHRAPSTIVGTPTWKQLAQIRDTQRIERAANRRRHRPKV